MSYVPGSYFAALRAGTPIPVTSAPAPKKSRSKKSSTKAAPIAAPVTFLQQPSWIPQVPPMIGAPHPSTILQPIQQISSGVPHQQLPSSSLAPVLVEDVDIRKTYHPDGSVKSVEYWKDGQLHRDDGPANEVWYENGQPMLREYYQHGELHRDFGPATEEWFEDGRPAGVGYYQRGQLHRNPLDGPAWVDRYENSQLLQREYLINGQRHRDDGPALEVWSEDGQLIRSEYYQHGQYIPQ